MTQNQTSPSVGGKDRYEVEDDGPVCPECGNGPEGVLYDPRPHPESSLFICCECDHEWPDDDGGQSVDGTDWEGHWPTDPTLTSGARDGFTLDINGTQLLFRTFGDHTPMLVEIWVEDESTPLGAINTATGETVTLGGVDESLAQRVDEIREMPVGEIPDALEELAYRLNPSGRENPETAEPQDTGTDRGEGPRTDGGSNRVGPVIFSNRKARSYLERHGSVVTFRTRNRTTGETHVRYERTGTKQYDCFIMKLASVAGVELEEQLEDYHAEAGFSSADGWKDAIQEMHGEVPDEGYLYRVDLPVTAVPQDTGTAQDGGSR